MDGRYISYLGLAIFSSRVRGLVWEFLVWGPCGRCTACSRRLPWSDLLYGLTSFLVEYYVRSKEGEYYSAGWPP